MSTKWYQNKSKRTKMFSLSYFLIDRFDDNSPFLSKIAIKCDWDIKFELGITILQRCHFVETFLVIDNYLFFDNLIFKNKSFVLIPRHCDSVFYFFFQNFYYRIKLIYEITWILDKPTTDTLIFLKFALIKNCPIYLKF